MDFAAPAHLTGRDGGNAIGLSGTILALRNGGNVTGSSGTILAEQSLP